MSRTRAVSGSVGNSLRTDWRLAPGL